MLALVLFIFALWAVAFYFVGLLAREVFNLWRENRAALTALRNFKQGE